jgi:hypothetical protein
LVLVTVLFISVNMYAYHHRHLHVMYLCILRTQVSLVDSCPHMMLSAAHVNSNTNLAMVLVINLVTRLARHVLSTAKLKNPSLGWDFFVAYPRKLKSNWSTIFC